MIPLVSARDPQAPIAFRAGVPVLVPAFVRDVLALAALLPAGGHVFNACTDRYRFAVSLCAALVAGKVSLLPPVQTADMLAQLREFAPDLFCLHDRDEAEHVAGSEQQGRCGGAEGNRCLPAGFPALRFPDLDATADAMPSAPPVPMPAIPADQTMAWLFTSGSTGAPAPHRKTWGEMVANARAGAARLGLAALAQDGACALVGTVPPQHMYGIECTIMLALHGAAALCAERPFYPADVAAALGAVPEPRILVTSPVHLRTLVRSEADLPRAALLLCATAPLDPATAMQAEQRFGAPLQEIYGSTETGHIATRRTAREPAWLPLPGICLDMPPSAQAVADRGETAEARRTPLVSGGHLPAPVPLNDAIDLLADGRFLLHGRHADMVNIAGKRSSLAYLTRQLLAVDGVADGAVVMPGEIPGARAMPGMRVIRPVALVVPDARLRTDPAQARAAVLRGLRERLDPAFLPRRVLLLDALPRSANGKLARAQVEALLTLATATATDTDTDTDTATARAPEIIGADMPGFRIAASHPALPGHFPGHPIVPGVVLLDHALQHLSASLGIGLARCEIGAAKFLSPVAPGEWVSVHHVRAGDTIRFTLQAGGRDVASGTLAAPAAPGDARP